MHDHRQEWKVPAPQCLTGELVQENTGHVEVSAGTEHSSDCLADLERRLARHTPHPATTAEQRGYVFHIDIKPTAFEAQRGLPMSHGCAVFGTGFAFQHFRFFPNLAFSPLVPLGNIRGGTIKSYTRIGSPMKIAVKGRAHPLFSARHEPGSAHNWCLTA